MTAADEPRDGADGAELRAELLILKSQLRQLKQENIRLRRGKSVFLQTIAEKEDEIRRKTANLEKEASFRDAEVFFSDSRSSCILSGTPSGTSSSASSGTPSGTSPDTRSQPCPSQSLAAAHGLFERHGRDMRSAIRDAVAVENLRSREAVARQAVLSDYFFGDFCSIDPDHLVRTIRAAELYGEPFVDVFMLYSMHRPVFESFWEEFFSLPLYIDEKRSVLENVPPEWILELLDRPPTPKGVFWFPEDADNDNCLKDYIKNNNPILYDFFIEVARKRPPVLPSLLSQDEFDQAVRLDSPLSRVLVRAIAQAGGLGYTDRMDPACFNSSHIPLLLLCSSSSPPSQSPGPVNFNIDCDSPSEMTDREA